jgi:mono/diheme cytochrome c family protein
LSLSRLEMQSMNTETFSTKTSWIKALSISVLMMALCAPFVAMRVAVAEETTPAAGNTSDPALIAKGKALYGTNCIHCHGINMVTPGTVAFDLRQFPHDDKARFVNSVTNGKNGRMPPWGDVLKPEEIDALWSYVLTGGKS